MTVAVEGLDATIAYRVHDHIVLRPEPFGALAYDLSTTKLLVLRDHDLVRVLGKLGDYDSAEEAVCAVAPKRQAALTRALAQLHVGGIIGVA